MHHDPDMNEEDRIWQPDYDDAADQANPAPRHTISPVDYVPQRVISLVPSITESMFDLNLGSYLIAVTEYCTHPADQVVRLPKIGGTKNPDLQAIIAMQPDLVIVNDEENRKVDAEALQQAGIPLWVTGPRTVKQAIDLLWDMMNIFENASMTPRVQQIDMAYEHTRRVMSSFVPIRTFVPIWRDPWMTFNAGTFAHDLLLTCGALNVFADRQRQFPLAADLKPHTGQTNDPRFAELDTRYPRLSQEEIIQAQPELILLPTEPYAFNETDGAFFSTWDVPAASTNHIYLIDGSLLTWHGTRMAYAFNELPALIDSILRGEE